MRIFKTFESFTEVTYQPKLTPKKDLIGKILHLYGSIPVPKEKSSIVIQKIVTDTHKKFFNLGEDVDPGSKKLHDKIRFYDYFDSLLSSKEVRGHNFEGLLAGLYGGELNKNRTGKWDVIIKGMKYSVKFINNKNERVQLGSYKTSITSGDNDELFNQIQDEGGLGKIFKEGDIEVKRKAFDKICKDSNGEIEVDGWIIAYPVAYQELEDDKPVYEKIVCHMLGLEDMKRLLFGGYTTSPKGGWKDLWSLAISTIYLSEIYSRKFEIKIPYVTIEDMNKLYYNREEENFSTAVFGNLSSKVRPDILRYIMKNRGMDFIQRVDDFFKNQP